MCDLLTREEIILVFDVDPEQEGLILVIDGFYDGEEGP